MRHMRFQQLIHVVSAKVIALFSLAIVFAAVFIVHGDESGVKSASAQEGAGKIAFISDRDDKGQDQNRSAIYTMRADGKEPKRITGTSTIDGYPSFSPNGNKIAFNSLRDGNYEIYTMNADGSGVTRLTHTPKLDYGPSFSPDGSKIVFTSRHAGYDDIYLMDADGSHVTALTGGPARGGKNPVFSPDGTKIAFWVSGISFSERGNYVFVMNSDGTNQKRLHLGIRPHFSPDGSKLVFRVSSSRGSHIFIINADGTDPQRLTPSETLDLDPDFSPDGTKIVFVSPDPNRLSRVLKSPTSNNGDDSDDKEPSPLRIMEQDQSDIYVMNLDGTNVKRLTKDAGNNTSPTWGK